MKNLKNIIHETLAEYLTISDGMLENAALTALENSGILGEMETYLEERLPDAIQDIVEDVAREVTGDIVDDAIDRLRRSL